tara:strand:+ start:240 stop:557 length:318 start_codon:yes stop_codon:yes gene_type:complete
MMTTQDKLNRLRERYVKWYVGNVSEFEADARQSWFERTREMNTWSASKGRFVPMSDTQAFTTLRKWFAEKSAINSYLQSKLYSGTITSEERERYFRKVYGNQYLA